MSALKGKERRTFCREHFRICVRASAATTRHLKHCRSCRRSSSLSLLSRPMRSRGIDATFKASLGETATTVRDDVLATTQNSPQAWTPTRPPRVRSPPVRVMSKRRSCRNEMWSGPQSRGVGMKVEMRRHWQHKPWNEGLIPAQRLGVDLERAKLLQPSRVIDTVQNLSPPRSERERARLSKVRKTPAAECEERGGSKEASQSAGVDEQHPENNTPHGPPPTLQQCAARCPKAKGGSAEPLSRTAERATTKGPKGCRTREGFFWLPRLGSSSESGWPALKRAKAQRRADASEPSQKG